MEETNKKISKGYKFSASGAGVVLISFFLPWILVSCNAYQVQLSGWDLAVGTNINNGYTTQHLNGDSIFFIIPISIIIVFVLAYLAYNKGVLNRTIDGYGIIGLGIIPLIFLLIESSNYSSRATQQGLSIDYQFGLFGTIIGYLLLIVGGYFNFTDQELLTSEQNTQNELTINVTRKPKSRSKQIRKTIYKRTTQAKSKIKRRKKPL